MAEEVTTSYQLQVSPVNGNHDAQGPVAKWVRSMWRPCAAIIYLFICLFDFVIAPWFIQVEMTSLSEIFTYILQMPSDQQAQALNTLTTPRSWESLTLQGGGLFHIAFGAILGASAWTRGMEKRERAAVEKVAK
jgi:hypothetical protein